jgi:hypothetical protein
MYRAKHLAKSINIDPIGLPSKTPIFVRINYMLREYFAVIKMYKAGRCWRGDSEL